MKKVLMTGNEAMAEGAIQAGCTFYAGYPITPQNEIPAYMASRMPEAGGVFIQAESELAAVNMVFGAAAAGVRALTSSSSPGISLKQEGISYLAGSQLPAVIINVMRGGPGLGNIWPAQSDYFQATRGGGHGDYHSIVLAPASVQEAYDLAGQAFGLADRYRMPIMILGDGMLGQMMEPLNIKSKVSIPKSKTKKTWALTGCKGRKPHVIRSFFLKEGDLEEFNLTLQKKYHAIQQREPRYEGLYLDKAKVVVVAYGTMSRIARSAVEKIRKDHKGIGLIRPITLWPFPLAAFQRFKPSAGKVKFLVTEMSYGQMLEDVKLALDGRFPVEFLGRAGGGIPTEGKIIQVLRRLSHA
ncbi:MAG: 3-methyl-2-oxobutanoate dehydrogenase subunit VorB [Candidatus Omnitrophota bacterium]